MTTDVIKLDSQHQLDQEIKQLLTTFAEKETEHTWQQFDDAFRRLSAIARGGAAEKFEAFMMLIKVKLKQSIVNSLSTERTRLSGTAVEFIEELSRQTGPDFQPLVDIYFPVILKLCARTNKVYITRAQHCLQTIITHSQPAFVIPRLVEAVMTSPSKTLRQCAAENIYLCVKELEDRELEPYAENLEESMRCGVLDQSSAVRECFKKICECYTGKFPDRTNAFISTLSDIAKKYFNFTKRSAPSSPALSSAKRAQFRKIKAASSLENSGDGSSDAVVFFNPGPSTHNLSNEFERNYDGFSKGPSIHDVPQGLPTAKSEPMLSSAAQYNGTLTSLNRITTSSADDLKQVSSNKHYEKMMGAIGALRSEQTPIPATPSMNHTVKAAATSTHPQGGGGGARRILNTAPARTTHIDNTATRQPASSLGNPLRVRRATEVQKEVPPTPQAAVKQNINQPTRVMRAAGDAQPARPPSRTVIGKETIQDTKTQQDGAEDKQEDRNGIKTNGNGASARPPSRSSKPESNKDLIPKTVSRPSHHHHEQQHPPERTTTRVQEPITPQQIFQNHSDVVTLWLKTARAPEWSVRAKALAVLGDELTSVCTSMAAKEDSDIEETGHRSLITKILDALLDGLADRNNLKIVNTVLSALLSAIGTTAISRPVGSPKPCTDQHRIFVHHLEPLYLRLLVLRETNQWRTNRVVLERIRVIFEAVNGRYSVRERMDALVGVMAEVAVFEKGMMGSANGGGLRGAVLGEVLNALEQQNGDENEDETKNWIKDEKNIRHVLIRLSSVAGTPDPTTRSLVKKLLTVIHGLAPSQTFCDVVGALKSGEKGILRNMLDALVVTGSSSDVASTTPLDLTERADHAQPMEIDELVSRGPTPLSNETGGKELEKNDIESIPIHEIESMSIHQNDLPTTRPVTPHCSIEELLDPNNLTSVLCASSRSNNADLQLKEVLNLASEVDNELWVRRASGVVDIALSALEGVLKRSVLNVDNFGDSARLLPCMSLLNTLVVHQLPNVNGKERDIIRALLNERLSCNRTPPTAASQLLHRGVQSTLQTIIKSWSTSLAISTILESLRDQIREDKAGNTLIVGTSTALTILNTILKRPKHGSEIMRVEFAENVLNYAVNALASSSPSVRTSAYDLITVMATRYSCPENRNEFSMALKKALASCPVAIRVVATRMIRQRISLA